jgi:hypothetical protein
MIALKNKIQGPISGKLYFKIHLNPFNTYFNGKNTIKFKYRSSFMLAIDSIEKNHQEHKLWGNFCCKWYIQTKKQFIENVCQGVVKFPKKITGGYFGSDRHWELEEYVIRMKKGSVDKMTEN